MHRRSPYPTGGLVRVSLWITQTFLWMSEVVQDLTSYMQGIDNEQVRVLLDLSTGAQGRTWALV
jgi:hypothetical protein